MNEFIFLSHILLALAFSFGALRMGPVALTCSIAIQGILANVFVLKQIKLFGLFVTCSDVFAIGLTVSLNLLQEFYGKKKAIEATKIAFGALLFFLCMSQVHLLYEPSSFDESQGAFLTLFSSSPRIFFASIFTFFVVQRFDIFFFSLLKGKLAVRMAISLGVSHFLDTALFSFLGLYGLVASVLQVMLISWTIKLLLIFVNSSLLGLSKRFVRHDVQV